MKLSFLLLSIVMLPAFSGAAFATGDNVVIRENVSTVYADVLRVTPVYQTLRTKRNEQVCRTGGDAETQVPSRAQKWLASLRNLTKKDTADVSTTDRLTGKGCRIVAVEREFQRPIAYDVDYIYRGMKFRSRLPEDPGTRLRIRIGVKPIIQ